MNSVNMFEVYHVADFTSSNQRTQDQRDKENEEVLAAFDRYLDRVTHKQTGELVAVKQLKFLDSEESFSIAVARELKLLMNLWHENIVLVPELAMGSSMK
uniref:SFRICE_026566 n=1 Tax=Spodoptera frugiperda TaxID=7108 RepID=A0A2H1VG64_SPOFR